MTRFPSIIAAPALLAGAVFLLHAPVGAEPPEKEKAAEKPAESEPAGDKKDAAAVDPTKAIEPLGGTRYRLGALTFDKATGVISVPAVVNMNKGLLEYVLVHESGKVHESLLSTVVKPMEFNVALLLLRWKPSEAFFDYAEPERGGVPVKGAKHPAASEMTLHIRWKDAAGAEQTVRLEQWLHNADKRAKITEGPFIYTGSRVMPDGTFLAQETGSLIALYVDPASVVNNPRDGNENDDVWFPDPDVPAKGTQVTLELHPTAPASGKPAGKAASPPAAKPGKKRRP